MREIRYFCPQCQSTELDITRGVVVRAQTIDSPTTMARAHCSICNWTGGVEEVIGALSEENQGFWTSERVANALIVAATKHAAGPMIQVLELIGLIPRIHGSSEEKKSAEEIRTVVMRAVLDGVVTSAFEAAANVSPEHFKKYDPPMAKLSRGLFGGGDDW